MSEDKYFKPELLRFMQMEAEKAVYGIFEDGQAMSFAERVAKAMAAATQFSVLVEEDLALRKEVSELKEKIDELIDKVDKVTLENTKLRAKVEGQNKNDEGQ